MPGIVGILSSLPGQECSRRLAAMLDAIAADDACRVGSSTHPELGIYAGWVAREDSYALQQCEALGTTGQRLLFCGECFGEEVDVAELPASLLIRYEREGIGFVDRLNGLFSGLLIDPTLRQAWLFNDRFGSERVYYLEDAEALYFASHARALLRVVPHARAFDDEGVADLLRYGSVQGGRTLFRGIGQLPGASLWAVDAGRSVCKSRYFRAADWEGEPPLSDTEYQEAFTSAFVGSMPAYLRSPTRIGISITGGLDTRMIMAALGTCSREPVCYTFAGLHGETRDATLGATVARHYGLPHHVLRVEPGFLAEFPSYVDRTVWATDGCGGATTAHEIHLTAQARQLAPVRLTGNFGSEILRSMSTLKPLLGLAPDLLAPDWRKRIVSTTERPQPLDEHPVASAAFREIPWHLHGTLAAARSQLTFRSPYLDNRLVRLAFRAPQSVRTSASSALLLIKALSPALAAIPTDRAVRLDAGPSQWVARAVAEATFKLDYYHKEGLPNALAWLDPVLRQLDHTRVLGQHKFLPYRCWFRCELADSVADVFHRTRVRCMPFWNAAALPSLLADHVRGRRNCTKEINAVLTLESVERQLFEPSAQAAPA